MVILRKSAKPRLRPRLRPKQRRKQRHRQNPNLSLPPLPKRSRKSTSSLATLPISSSNHLKTSTAPAYPPIQPIPSAPSAAQPAYFTHNNNSNSGKRTCNNASKLRSRNKHRRSRHIKRPTVDTGKTTIRPLSRPTSSFTLANRLRPSPPRSSFPAIRHQQTPTPANLLTSEKITRHEAWIRRASRALQIPEVRADFFYIFLVLMALLFLPFVSL